MSNTLRNESERSQTASASAGRTATDDIRRTLRDARNATELTQGSAIKTQELAREGVQAAKDLQRDLRNAPGAQSAGKEVQDAASRALDDIARAQEEQRSRLADDVTRAVQATAAAEQRPAPQAEKDHTLEETKAAVHTAVRQIEDAQVVERQRAAAIIVDPARTADQRALDLRALADEVMSTVRLAADEGTALDRARQNAQRTGAALTPDEAKALDQPLRDTLGPELADRLDDGAKARMAIAARQDASSANDNRRVIAQLREELAGLAAARESTLAVRFGSEATSRLSRGNFGEKAAAEALARRNFQIASYKPDVRGTNQGGIDIVALRRDEKTKEERLYLIDNKALTRAGAVTSVSALTTNLEQNIKAVAEEFAELFHNKDALPEQRQLARRVLDAIAGDRISLAVTNANVSARDEFTDRTSGKAAELEFIEVVREERDTAAGERAEKENRTLREALGPERDKRMKDAAKEAGPWQGRVVSPDQVRRAAEEFARTWAERNAAEAATLNAARVAGEAAAARDRELADTNAKAQQDAAEASRREAAAREEVERVLAERDAAHEEE